MLMAYLQVNSMAKFLCGSKKFCIVTCFNMISCYFHVNFMPHLKMVIISYPCHSLKNMSDLQKLAVASSESDQGHLAGHAGDLLHQEGQLGRPGLPVLHLHLGTEVIPLNPQLFTFHQEVLDCFHPLFQVAFKSEYLQ